MTDSATAADKTQKSHTYLKYAKVGEQICHSEHSIKLADVCVKLVEHIQYLLKTVQKHEEYLKKIETSRGTCTLTTKTAVLSVGILATNTTLLSVVGNKNEVDLFPLDYNERVHGDR